MSITSKSNCMINPLSKLSVGVGQRGWVMAKGFPKAYFIFKSVQVKFHLTVISRAAVVC